MARDPAVINAAYGIATKRGASPKVLLALFEAGIVESQFQNLNYGMDDSTGYLQQRVSQGWKDPMNVTTATNAFLDQAIAYEKAHPGADAGTIAQAVQKSGVPLAYGQNEQAALELLKTVDPAKAAAAAASAALTGAPGGLLPGGVIGDALGALLERIGKAADAFTSKAKIVEGIATSTTKIFLPSSLLRGASGVIGAVLLCFALYFLGRELRA